MLNSTLHFLSLWTNGIRSYLSDIVMFIFHYLPAIFREWARFSPYPTYHTSLFWFLVQMSLIFAKCVSLLDHYCISWTTDHTFHIYELSEVIYLIVLCLFYGIISSIFQEQTWFSPYPNYPTKFLWFHINMSQILPNVCHYWARDCKCFKFWKKK